MNRKVISIFVALAFILIQLPTFAASSETVTLYLDTSEINPILPIVDANPTVFELPIKAVDSLSGTGIFSYKLVLNFDEQYIKAKDISGNAIKGIEIIKKLDNENGLIEYWFSFNGNIPSDKILATVKFEVIKKGSASIEISDASELRKEDLGKINVIYSDDEDKDSSVKITVGEEKIAKPIFSTTTTTFSSTLLVKFASRTDGATIYYTTSTKGNDPDENDEKYNDGIRISNTTTIRAVAIKNGITSDVAKKTFTRVRDEGGNGGGGTSKNPLVIAQPTVTPAPTPATSKKEFSDISSHWSKGFIEKLVAKGIINGYEDGTVRPDNKITRAEAAKIIISALGIQPAQSTDLPFADSLAIGDWAKGYIQKAVDMGIMTGYEDNTFKPAQNVSRKELVVIAARAFALAGDSAEELSFDDKDSIPDWAKQSVAAALKLNIISGFEDNTFKPDNFVTRGESSKIISSCMDLKK